MTAPVTPGNGGGKGLTAAYIIMGLCVLGATVIAVLSLTYSRTGRAVCDYIRHTYPASHAFRVQQKGFIYDHYKDLKEEARAYRASAAQEPDAVTARLDRLLADQLDAHAAVALRDWKKIKITGPPTCS